MSHFGVTKWDLGFLKRRLEHTRRRFCFWGAFLGVSGMLDL